MLSLYLTLLAFLLIALALLCVYASALLRRVKRYSRETLDTDWSR